MSSPSPDVAELLQTIRATESLSQEALADELGVSYPTVNAWENRRHRPRAVHRLQIEQLARKAGVLESPSVLAVVDDEPLVSRLSSHVAATGRDTSLVATRSVTEGLVLCGRMQPDVLLVDEQLDLMDVDRLLATLAADDSTADTVVLVRTDDPERWEAADRGDQVTAMDVDVDPDVVAKTVATLLRER